MDENEIVERIKCVANTLRFAALQKGMIGYDYRTVLVDMADALTTDVVPKIDAALAVARAEEREACAGICLAHPEAKAAYLAAAIRRRGDGI